VGQVRAQRSVRVVVAILVGWIAFAWVFGGAAWRPAQAQQPVGQIVIEGNQRVESATVRSYMAIAAGEVATATAVDRSLKALFATGLFSDVSIRQEGSNLVVTVVENPIINRLAFEGNRRLDDKALEAEVQLRPRIVYTRARVQNDVQRIVQLYRRSGRFAATVEPKVIQLPQQSLLYGVLYHRGAGDRHSSHQLRRQSRVQRPNAARRRGDEGVGFLSLPFRDRQLRPGSAQF
jgi:outer membrane protein assembly factor BamA